MDAFNHMFDDRLLKFDFRGRVKTTITLIVRNPAIASLWFVAIYTGSLGCVAYVDLQDVAEYAPNGKMAGIAVYAILKAGLYWLISVVAAGFALVLASLEKTAQVLSTKLSVDGIDIDVPVILEEGRLERVARAAEKRFNDGDTTAREYRTAIAEIEKRRWQLRAAATSKS